MAEEFPRWANALIALSVGENGWCGGIEQGLDVDGASDVDGEHVEVELEAEDES